MFSVNEFFYGEEAAPQFMIQTSAQQIIRDPKLFTLQTVEKPKPKEEKKEEKNKPHVMRVSICCDSCVDVLKSDFSKVSGIKTVETDIYRKKVTVTGTATFADVISAARRHFKDAELYDD